MTVKMAIRTTVSWQCIRAKWIALQMLQKITVTAASCQKSPSNLSLKRGNAMRNKLTWSLQSYKQTTDLKAKPQHSWAAANIGKSSTRCCWNSCALFIVHMAAAVTLWGWLYYICVIGGQGLIQKPNLKKMEEVPWTLIAFASSPEVISTWGAC